MTEQDSTELGESFPPVRVGRRTAIDYRVINDHGVEVVGTRESNDSGMAVVELISGAVAACFAITLDQITEHDGIDAGDISVTAQAQKTAGTPARFAIFRVSIRAPGLTDKAERTRLIALAKRLCTVTNTFRSDVKIEIVDETERAIAEGAAVA